MKTISFDEAVYKLVPVAESPKWRENLTEIGYSHRSVIADVLAAVPDDLPGVVEHDGEPVEYQTRMRPAWIHNGEGYTAWEPCSAGTYSDKEKLGTYNDWEYEVRKLFTHPPAQPDTAMFNAMLMEASRIDGAMPDTVQGMQPFSIELSLRDNRIYELDARNKELAERLEWARQDLIKQADIIDGMQAQIVGLEAEGERLDAGWHKANGDALYAAPPAPANSLAIVQANTEQWAEEFQSKEIMCSYECEADYARAAMDFAMNKIRDFNPQSILDGMKK